MKALPGRGTRTVPPAETVTGPGQNEPMSKDPEPRAAPPACAACRAVLRIRWVETYQARITEDVLIASAVGLVGECSSCGQRWFCADPEAPSPCLELI